MRPRMLWMAVLAVLVGATHVGAEEAALPRETLEIVRRVVVQHNGRHKPFDSFARETLRQITGVARLGGQDPVATLLDMMAHPEAWQTKPLVVVPFRPLREPLGMDARTPRISYNDLVASRKLMRLLPPIVQKQERDDKLSMLENETMDAFQRFVAVSQVFEQQLHLVPPPDGATPVWSSLQEPAGLSAAQAEDVRGAWAGLIAAVRAGQPAAMTPAAQRAAEALRAINPGAYPPSWQIQLEVFYNHFAPFHVARILYLAAVAGLLLGLAVSSRWVTAGLAACWAAYVVHGAGIAMRVIIGGRPPVSNFFETTLWLPFVAVTIALVLERIYRARYIALAAAILSAIALILADYLPLDSSVSPVVAVLRSNLWLTIHVLTIVASYGAIALATVLAHVYGVMYLRAQGARQTLRQLDLFLYRTLQVGVVLLASGTMLGAVWANASWGRYWGWDPKETWALITLLWFLAVLHGRFAGWLRGVWVALSTISGFFLLLMTYYGVSFYLAGLHSYAGGRATPLPPLLIGYLIAEVVFMGWVGSAALNRKTSAG